MNENNDKFKLRKIKTVGPDDIKTKAKILRGILNEVGLKEGVELKLRKKAKAK